MVRNGWVRRQGEQKKQSSLHVKKTSPVLEGSFSNILGCEWFFTQDAIVNQDDMKDVYRLFSLLGHLSLNLFSTANPICWHLVLESFLCANWRAKCSWKRLIDMILPFQWTKWPVVIFFAGGRDNHSPQKSHVGMFFKLIHFFSRAILID